jgi:hypothetical protein
MASTLGLWIPPAGMTQRDITAWRAFYSKILDQHTVSPSDYRLMYVAQCGRCWICRTARGIHPDDPKARGSRRLGIDHDHLTGDVRGLLCTGGDKTCNRIIGWLNAPQLLRAADYLSSRRHQPGRVMDQIRSQVTDARRNGIELSDDDIDKLAVSLLWAES